MLKAENQIRDFMQKAGQECPTAPCIPSEEIRLLRAKLIFEEAMETISALGVQIGLMNFTCPFVEDLSIIPTNGSDEEGKYFYFRTNEKFNLIEVADGCADLKVVTIGTEIACGIPSALTWEEVHKSNMSKFIDGYKREDGKWMKGAAHKPANLKPILEGEVVQSSKEDEEDFIAYIGGFLAELPCCHEKGTHESTPPMMWPELISCIIQKAKQDAIKEERKRILKAIDEQLPYLLKEVKPFAFDSQSVAP